MDKSRYEQFEDHILIFKPTPVLGYKSTISTDSYRSLFKWNQRSRQDYFIFGNWDVTWDEDRGTTSPTNAQFCEDWAETDTHVNGSTSSIIIGNIVSLLMKNSLTSFPSLPLNQSLNFWFTLALLPFTGDL